MSIFLDPFPNIAFSISPIALCTRSWRFCWPRARNCAALLSVRGIQTAFACPVAAAAWVCYSFPEIRNRKETESGLLTSLRSTTEPPRAFHTLADTICRTWIHRSAQFVELQSDTGRHRRNNIHNQRDTPVCSELSRKPLDMNRFHVVQWNNHCQSGS